MRACCGLGSMVRFVLRERVMGVDGSCAWRVLVFRLFLVVSLGHRESMCEYEKGIWWMPWRQEAMKDVARCENPGGAASRL